MPPDLVTSTTQGRTCDASGGADQFEVDRLVNGKDESGAYSVLVGESVFEWELEILQQV